jgi:hypothetical protein
MKKISYLIFGIVILIVIFISLPSILNLFTKDIDPIDDSDLSLQIISIPDKDNAYFDLIKIKDVIYEPEGRSKDIADMVDQKMWDEELAEEIVSRNQEAFEYFSKASHKPKYQNPVLADPKNINPNIVFPSLNSWRRMAQFSSIRTSYLSKQGKDKEAIHEALNSVYIGQKMQESQVSFLGYLVAISIKETGLENMQRAITSSNLSTEELKKYAKDMNQFYKNEDGFTIIFKGEYYMQSLIIDALVNGNTEILESYTEEQSQDISQRLKNNYYFKPNKTKAIFAEYARKNIKNANEFCNNIQNIDIQMLASSSYLELYLTENSIGKILHDVIATSLSSVNIKKCEEDSLVSATQVLIAIKAYQNDNGDYPDSLEQLVPDYLSSVPLDYFDGSSLRYSKEDKILYSIGEDLKDDGGSIGDDWKKMPDPTFKINF